MPAQLRALPQQKQTHIYTDRACFAGCRLGKVGDAQIEIMVEEKKMEWVESLQSLFLTGRSSMCLAALRREQWRYLTSGCPARAWASEPGRAWTWEAEDGKNSSRGEEANGADEVRARGVR
jgi:hypothetical protein